MQTVSKEEPFMNPMHTIRFETDCPGDTIHLHDEMELLYTLQGRCAVFADGKNFVLGKEDFAVFNPFSSHQLYREEGAHTLSLYIPIQLLNQAEIGTITVFPRSSRKNRPALHCSVSVLQNYFAII